VRWRFITPSFARRATPGMILKGIDEATLPAASRQPGDVARFNALIDSASGVPVLYFARRRVLVTK
jgi:hypothetical protein